MKKFTEPKLIKAGSESVLLGMFRKSPQVDVRIITEENYQLLYKAFLKLNGEIKSEDKSICPKCKSSNTEINHAIRYYDCEDCGYDWVN